MASVSFAHETAARIDAEYISQQATRMEGSADTEPDLAIGTAKEFVESICKTILDEREEPNGKNDDLLALVRKTTKILQMTPDDIASAARAAETIKRVPLPRSASFCTRHTKPASRPAARRATATKPEGRGPLTTRKDPQRRAASAGTRPGGLNPDLVPWRLTGPPYRQQSGTSSGRGWPGRA
jgi:hypothetical protein